MPYVAVTISKSVPDDFAGRLSQLVSEYLHKPEKYVMVSVNKVDVMVFGGVPDPCAFVDVRALGMTPAETNYKEFSKVLSALVEEQAGVKADRIFLNFGEVERSNW
eukprot:CAMPEP_0119132182 /NCGR_PEP_ID=MMETSP1310-20130426/11705_1 /TAXON_ID=464262 /ORGANISM="Genus nov. species nov., Strain RCC2339" /LENGTH=105 /DNA_ID=CAMNT_0007122801 /DNA_START=70 /DNA_END=384 /DNA_ORIENTATION=+